MSIPKIIHYVWVGPNRLPAQARELITGWTKMCPGYEIKLWDETNIDFRPRFLRQAQGVRAYNRISNFVRAAALVRYGGFYLDHDVELVKPLDELLQHSCILGYQSTTSSSDINGAIIGAKPDHPFLKRVTATLNGMDGAYDWGPMTGPGLLTRLMRESGATGPRDEPYICDNVTLFPPRYFYPYEWDAEYTPECITPDTVAIHHWDFAWERGYTRKDHYQMLARRAATKISATLASKLVRASDLKAKSQKSIEHSSN